MSASITFASGYTVDADTYTAATHTVELEPTAYPVETGAEISDHVLRKPRRLSLDLVVTPSALDGDPSGADRPEVAWRILRDAMGRRETCRILVDGEAYDPAVILSLTMPRAHEDGDGRRFTVEAQVIETVQAATAKRVAGGASGIKHKHGLRKKGPVPATAADPKLQAMAALVVQATRNAQGL